MAEQLPGSFIWNVDRMLSLAGKAGEIFREALQQSDFALFQEKYYLARDILRRSEGYYAAALESIRVRKQFPEEMYLHLAGHHPRAEEAAGKSKARAAVHALLPAVLAQLEKDPVLLRWMSTEEIRLLVKRHLPAQLTGARKLANLKLRLAFEKVEQSLTAAQKLAEKARLRYLQLRTGAASEKTL